MVQGGGITQALQMSGAAILITSLEGWLLTPALMGKAERMSAPPVFLGLLLWTWLWGPGHCSSRADARRHQIGCRSC
jgi:predicted PurR-regulated permease PerM